MLDVMTIATPGLGDRSYVVTDGAAAVVVDPQRDLDRIDAVLDGHALTVTHVLETHVHNDYVSGGVVLAGRRGAVYGVAAEEDVAFDRLPLHDGDELDAGGFGVRVVHTPGHTPGHLTFVAGDGRAPGAALTGGSLLYGTVGRTDLSGADRTDPLTRAQYRSVRGLLGDLDEPVTVHPTHGFGSFCASASGSGGEQSTIGVERRHNLAATADGEDDFVAQLLGGLTAYPSYYARMAPLNLAGAPPADLSPAPDASAAQLQERIAVGEWVVDLRQRRAFAAGHLAGTVNIEADDPFATYLGWTIPWGTPVTLVGEDADQVALAQRALVRIGIDRPAAQSLEVTPQGAPSREYRVADFAGLARGGGSPGDGLLVLDVRRDDEWADGHLDGALHVPLPELERRLTEIPEGRELWVHCASGFRAAIGASLLDRAGRDVVLVDDDWPNAETAGLPVVRP